MKYLNVKRRGFIYERTTISFKSTDLDSKVWTRLNKKHF